MGAILIVLWLVVLPVGLMVTGFALSVLAGAVLSTGEDGDPPPFLLDDS
jgi:hypothetical protein